MTIVLEWHGHGCFRLKAAGASVVMDPYRVAPETSDAPWRADIVTISHAHRGHDNAAGVAGEPFVITGPGEYEVRGVFVTGVHMAHDARGGADRGPVTAYTIVADDLAVCHLGDLGHVPTQEHVDAIGRVDVLLVPVGGGHTVGPREAAEAVRLIEPAVVVPMHFRSETRPDLEAVERFLSEMGVDPVDVEPCLQLSRAQLPESTQVHVLEARWQLPDRSPDAS